MSNDALAARRLLDHHRDQRAHQRLLAAGGPQLRLGRRAFPCPASRSLSRASASSTEIGFTSAASRSSAVAQAQVLAERLLPPVRPDVRDHRLGVLAGASACSRISPSPPRRYVDAGLVGDAPRARARARPTAPPRRASARQSPRASGPSPRSTSRGVTPRRSSERTKPFSSSRVRASRRAARRPRRSTPRRARRRRRRGTRPRSPPRAAPRMRPSMSARSSASVSNSLAARASSSSSAGSTFSLISLTVTSTLASSRPRARTRPASSRRRSPDERLLDLLDQPPDAELDDVSRCASPSALTRSTTTSSPSRAGRSSAGTSSATVRAARRAPR